MLYRSEFCTIAKCMANSVPFLRCLLFHTLNECLPLQAFYEFPWYLMGWCTQGIKIGELSPALYGLWYTSSGAELVLKELCSLSTGCYVL